MMKRKRSSWRDCLASRDMLARGSCIVALWALGVCNAYTPQLRVRANRTPAIASRRDLFARTAGAFSLAIAGQSQALEENEVEVYFGCGCFWHVQHEFVEAERSMLGRSDDMKITARAGYAGGLSDSNPKVCYHNAFQVRDYGSLGHAEVVRLRIPPSKFQAFAEVYFNLFDERGDRPDQAGDRGPEYRNVIGIPGGGAGPLYAQLEQACLATGDRLDLSRGRSDGKDGDSRANVWVMDTSKSPFFVAEPYHQFHDGFKLGEDYPASYNDMSKKLLSAGLFEDSKCPAGMIGLGIGGL